MSVKQVIDVLFESLRIAHLVGAVFCPIGRTNRRWSSKLMTPGYAVRPSRDMSGMTSPQPQPPNVQYVYLQPQPTNVMSVFAWVTAAFSFMFFPLGHAVRAGGRPRLVYVRRLDRREFPDQPA